ncbi:hypothetical protein [Roseisalinus antarcticus]|uniref:Lipoprotein n=1 Tax=Roseisalinus antarcticus TaxID=254357 RepID=A0A1Y5T2Y6_9RHOB|nr:hypothetical protein [Roseisalinus antarcticus]SLN54358.1 hypothetical protein ROA7023_02427 [Roseisalinus antarcticus]
MLRGVLTLPLVALLGGCGGMGGAPSASTAAPMSDPYGTGGPPAIGRITDAGGPGWTTYDFSVGAVDPSAHVSPRDGVPTLTLVGFPPGEPFAESGRLQITAPLAAVAPGPASGTARISGGEVPLEGPATVTIDAVSPPAPDELLGRISGSYSARLCPAGGADAGCESHAGTFSTRAALP